MFLRVFLICSVLAFAVEVTGLDRERYIGIDELKVGMTGVGKTVLNGAEPVEFFVELLSIVRNFGPKQDVLIARLSGAGLERTGIIEGMSGSPVYFDGRLAGAVAFAWPFGKEPIAGIQPVEQMLAVTDEHSWKKQEKRLAATATRCGDKQRHKGTEAQRHKAGTKGRRSKGTKRHSATRDPKPETLKSIRYPLYAKRYPVVPPALIAVAQRPPSVAKPSPLAAPVVTTGLSGDFGGQAISLRPIRTPVMVSGAAPRVLDFLKKQLLPYGLVPVQAGGSGGSADKKVEKDKVEKFQPGSVLCVSLMTGDLDLTAAGTVTEVDGDKVYGLGHGFFGMGEADYPISTGRALFVFPSQFMSFRAGAPVKEVGRLTWDERTAVLCRIGDQRARMVPVEVEVLGPDEKARQLYRYRIVHHRLLSGSLATAAAINSLLANRDLPEEVTLRYNIRIEPHGRDAIVLKNVYSGRMAMFAILFQLMGTTDVVMNNVFEPLSLKAVRASIQVVPKTHLARIRSARAMKNAVRPGQDMPVEIILQTYRGPDKRIVELVPIPAGIPNGTYRLTVCGAAESLREEMRERPNRYRPRSVEEMLWILRRDEPQDSLFLRFHLPAAKGLAVAGDELPGLPESVRTILAESAQDVNNIEQPRVTRKPMDMVIGGFQNVMIRVDDRAPRE